MGGLLLFLIVGTASLILLLGGKGPTSALNNNPGQPTPTPTATDPTVPLPDRAAPLAEPLVTPEGVTVRDISFGSRAMNFREKLINTPAIFGNEVFYSAGSGSLESKNDVLKRLYIYNLETGAEQKILETKLAGAGYYETQINTDWLVWLETDHYDKNNIYMMNRKDGTTTLIKKCKNGKPKLRLAGDTLIWMEPVDKDSDQLMMVDLPSQENLSLAEFNGASSVTYGLMAPGIYVEPVEPAEPGASASASAQPSPTPTPTPSPASTPAATARATAGASAQPEESAAPDWVKASRFSTTIVWADADKAQTEEQKQTDGEHSTIYWLKLGEDAIQDDNGTLKTQQFSPGTYVNAPQFNGKHFIWSDRNFAPNSNLYLCEPFGTPKVIDTNVTTFSLGDGIVVYGKASQVWVYVISTGEYCRLTSGSESGMLPYANGRSVVWYDKTDGGVDDKLRYKVLSDQDILPGAP